MKKKKSLLRRLLPWLFTAVVLTLIVVFIGIPLYSPQEVEELDPPVVSYYEGGKKPLVMENDSLLFELDPTTTHFTLTEKASGRKWLSNPENAASDPKAGNSAANKGLLQSTLVVTYSSSDGVIDYNNYQYAIENGNYIIEQQEDGSIDITYSVGKIEKIYMLPSAITVERFDTFIAEMAKPKASRVKKAYTQYTPEKVAALEDADREALLALYPEAANQALYVLLASTSENNKKSIAEIFANAGYTQEDYDLDMQLVAGASENKNPVFNVTITYRLDGADFIAEVPYDRIRYRAEYPITFITVLPMFGAAGETDEGFMLVPEGGGALIRYNNGKLKQTSYYANMYGWDYATERTEVVSETKCTFPVFGMSRADGSFICIMEGATSYGGVQADVSMRYNSYNWICAKYNVLHSDRYNVSAKTERLVYMFEKEIPDDTIVQRYRFVDSSHYADMAVVYGDYLRQSSPELAAAQPAEDMPVSVEMVGAIDKTIVKLGMPVDSIVATTTFAEAESMIGSLASAGVKDMSVRFSGWANGGITQKVLTGIKVPGVLGGKKGMASLIKAAGERSVPLYFDGVTCFAYDSGLLEGFIPYRDAARFTTREQIAIHPYSVITYQPEEWRDPFYLVQPSYAKANADTLIAGLKDAGAAGVAFRDIGSLLSADYNPKNTTTREQVKQQNIDTMLAAKEAGQLVMIKEGFDFTLPYADLITDMDLKGSGYAILDESVPFYQIALHGAADYTGMPVNLASDWKTELLRCAEYGAGLNFTFMAKDTKILQDSFHSGYYGAYYGAWEDTIGGIITDYQRDMAGLNRTVIVGHDILEDGVTVTRYANGTNVYVNYTNSDCTAEGVTIAARSYHVEGGEAK
ncbi:MAG: hypothetical protein J6K32_06375 [Clostridia bacterium]|nr:hypothetical protein [Clostridia bacterium]